jgi:hypothetical protein
MTCRSLLGLVVLATVSLSGASVSLDAQVVHDVLTPSSRSVMVTLGQFQPDREAVDGPFECRGPEIQAASILFPHNALVYSAFAPTQAEPRASILVFVDSAGNILHYSERRGPAIRPDTRGLTPAQVGEAVQAAVRATRATTISIDYIGQRASIHNVGGDQADQRVIARPDDVVHLEKLGKPGERAERILAACRTSKP